MQLSWPNVFRFIGKSSPNGISQQPEVIARRASIIASMLHANGVDRGDRVALWLQDGSDKIAAMLGCWMAGAAFCVLPAYAAKTDSERSQDRVGSVLSVLKPKIAIESAASLLPDAIASTVPTISVSGLATAPAGGSDPLAAIASRSADDMAFVQFTSGSTGGTPKGAEVRFAQLQANLDALASRTCMSRDDRMVSWAPLYHDMGLMAVLLSLRCGADLVLMETDHFVRRPSAWLDAISAHRGTVTTAPPTALKLLTRRRAPGADLGTLRYAWIGGEAVFPVVLEEFAACYADAGLKAGVLQPTYGMAETVVGISCGVPGTHWVTERGFASCGPPLAGMEVRIEESSGASADEGVEGRILVRGPSVIAGYLGLPRFPRDGWFDTGDLGFLKDGLLFVTGRTKDVLKRGAESFPASLVEAVAESVLDLRTGRVAAFANLRPDLGKEEIVLLVESRDWDDHRAREVAAAITNEFGLQVDVIRAVRGGRLPRTSSGKLMRQMTAAQYREGLL